MTNWIKYKVERGIISIPYLMNGCYRGTLTLSKGREVWVHDDHIKVEGIEYQAPMVKVTIKVGWLTESLMVN